MLERGIQIPVSRQEKEEESKETAKGKGAFFLSKHHLPLTLGKKIKNLLHFIDNYFSSKWGFKLKWIFLLRGQNLALEILLLPT